jgi:hypothetical protein
VAHGHSQGYSLAFSSSESVAAYTVQGETMIKRGRDNFIFELLRIPSRWDNNTTLEHMLATGSKLDGTLWTLRRFFRKTKRQSGSSQ